MIYVESEFAQLRTVVLAASEFSYPNKPRPEDLRFLDMAVVRETFENKGKDYAEAFPESQKRWEAEREELKRVLEKHGVQVFHPRKLTTAEKDIAGDDGYCNFFVRDPFFTIGHCVIEGSMRFLHRRNEVLPVREIMLNQVYPADCVYISAPRPEIPSPEDLTLGAGPFIEGAMFWYWVKRYS